MLRDDSEPSGAIQTHDGHLRSRLLACQATMPMFKEPPTMTTLRSAGLTLSGVSQ